MRAINADAIPYTMLYKENWLKGTGVEKPGVWKDTINAMPTIEPERKKGKWTVKEGKLLSFDECSVCRKVVIHRAPHYNFCPHCGADMRGDDHDL